MTELSLQKLTDVIKGKLYGDDNQIISEIITDSRSVVSSKKAIFFALEGERNDGHNYILDLYQRGIINFIVSEYKNDFKKLKGVNFIVVENTFKALHMLGKFHRINFKNVLLCVIGSNGKTIVKEWLYQLLHEDIETIRSPKSYNSQLGVAMSLTYLNANFQFGIIEAGISEPGEMNKLEKIVKPDMVLFTSFGGAHQENFKSLEHKAKEKLLMAKNTNTLIYSVDDEIVKELILKNDIFLEKNIFSWSVKSTDADLYLKDLIKHDGYTDIIAQFKEREIKFSIPFIDEASVKNSFSCLSYLLIQGLLSEEMLHRFARLEPVEMRIEQKEAINNCTLINDSYNSDLVSFKIAVDLLTGLSKTKKKTIILSDIFQSGMTDDVLYRSVFDMISDNGIDRFIGIGKTISQKRKLFNGSILTEFYPTTRSFLKQDLRKKFKNEVILLKGSRSFKFEKISGILELKKHRTVLEINLEAITHNLNYYKSIVPSGSKIMVMVKAFSYGSGTHEIASLLQHHHIDYLGVAFADEGVKLRKAGITTKIIVMNSDEESISDIIEYKLEPEIYNFRILDAFSDRLDDYSLSKMPVHIKLDTGMNRLGFCLKDVDTVIRRLKEKNNLVVKSVFSHLVAADEPIHDEFTNRQIADFKESSDKIIRSLNYPIIRHIANTSGIERFPEAIFDMVRVGIGIYGFNNNDNDKLMNVSTLKTRITQLKEVKKGESVSYGRKWMAKTDSKIAVIPIGYADGLSRKLSNEAGEVLVKGTKVHIVGNICMDMCMINVTGLNVHEGDEVIIFGDDYPASEIAKKLNTIPYEIITGISERVKRVYIG